MAAAGTLQRLPLVSIIHFLRLLGQQQEKKSLVLLLTWQIDLQPALGFSWGLLHAIDAGLSSHMTSRGELRSTSECW
jgi:hypothetical protein